MKKTVLTILIFSFAAALLYAQSEEDTENEVNPDAGPTRKPVAGFTILTAADARVTTDGKTTNIEDIYTYVGRKFKAVEARLKKIEAAEKDLKNRVESIESRLTGADEAALASKETPEETPQEGQSS